MCAQLYWCFWILLDSLSEQVTLTFLQWMKNRQKPRMSISENVVTGNIQRRICEYLSDCMDSKANRFKTKMLYNSIICNIYTLYKIYIHIHIIYYIYSVDTWHVFWSCVLGDATLLVRVLQSQSGRLTGDICTTFWRWLWVCEPSSRLCHFSPSGQWMLCEKPTGDLWCNLQRIEDTAAVLVKCPLG